MEEEEEIVLYGFSSSRWVQVVLSKMLKASPALAQPPSACLHPQSASSASAAAGDATTPTPQQPRPAAGARCWANRIWS